MAGRCVTLLVIIGEETLGDCRELRRPMTVRLHKCLATAYDVLKQNLAISVFIDSWRENGCPIQLPRILIKRTHGISREKWLECNTDTAVLRPPLMNGIAGDGIRVLSLARGVSIFRRINCFARLVSTVLSSTTFCCLWHIALFTPLSNAITQMPTGLH